MLLLSCHHSDAYFSVTIAFAHLVWHSCNLNNLNSVSQKLSTITSDSVLLYKLKFSANVCHVELWLYRLATQQQGNNLPRASIYNPLLPISHNGRTALALTVDFFNNGTGNLGLAAN